MTYLYLALAIVFEVGWALGLKMSQGLTRPGVAAVTLVMYIASLAFLALAVKKLDVGPAYAIWAGTGAALIAVAGIVWFKEPVSGLKVVSMVLVVAGVVGLNLAGGGHGVEAGTKALRHEGTEGKAVGGTR
jgi:multidrug transporter EmrE-like cation transporter